MRLRKFFILTMLVTSHVYSAHGMEKEGEDYISGKTEKLSVITPYTGINFRGKITQLSECRGDNLYDTLEAYYLKNQWKEERPCSLKTWLKPNTFDPIEDKLDLFEVIFSRWVNPQDQKGAIVIWRINGNEDSLDTQIDAYKKDELKDRNTQIRELLKGSYHVALKAFAAEFQKDNQMYYSVNMTSGDPESGEIKQTNPGFKKILDALKLKPIESHTEEVTVVKTSLSFGDSQVKTSSTK